jgi:hypothetical protein
MSDDWALGCGRSAIRAILAVRSGQAPEFVANKEVLDRPGFKAPLREHL